MRAGEAFRWCYRHSANLEFDAVQGGIQLTLTVKRKKALILQKRLMIRDHDKAADDVTRFIDAFAREYNME